jgi:hypothetical protein
MIDRRAVFKALVSIAMLPAISGLSRATRAQEVDAPAAVDLAGPEVVRIVEHFDTWIDQIVGGNDARESADLGRLSEQLKLKLDWIAATCKTSEPQMKKLQIAGRGDIKRLVDEMREIKRRYRQVKGDPVEFGKIQQRLAVIQSSSGSETFGDSSLLSKTLRTTLSAEQIAAIEREEEASRAFECGAAVLQAVQFCDVAIGMKDDQRRKLTELFVLETRRKRDRSPGSPVAFSTILMTAKMSPDRFKAIFDERQWRRMSDLLKEVEQNGNVVGFQGILGNGNVILLDVQGFAGDMVIAPEPPGVPADADEE